MLLQATTNNQIDIPKKFRKYAFAQHEDDSLPLTVGKKYVVSATKTVDSTIFYLILADDGELKGYPWWYPATLFSLINDAYPTDWVTANEGGGFTISGFDELVNDPNGEYYNALEDGDPQAVTTFLKHYETYARHYKSCHEGLRKNSYRR